MGFGLPAAIGAQFANPDRLVLDVDGDASLRMNLGEFETVTTYNLPIKVVVLNNYGDGMVKQWQKLFYKGGCPRATSRCAGRTSSRRPRPMASATPCASTARPTCPRVVQEFMEFQGPAFLEVIIDPDAACTRWSGRAWRMTR